MGRFQWRFLPWNTEYGFEINVDHAEIMKNDFLFLITTLKSHIKVQFCGKIGGISVERKEDSATFQVSKLIIAGPKENERKMKRRG